MARSTTSRRNPRLRVVERAADWLSVGDLEAEIESWIAEGRREACSPSTLDQRRRILAKLLAWLLAERHRRLGPEEMAGYLDHLTLAETPRLKPSTIGCYYGYLCAFCGYLVRENVLTESPMRHLRRPRVPEDQIRPFTAEQIERLRAAAQSSPDPIRNDALLLLLLDTGMRVSELCGLTLGDVDLTHKRCRVLGKGRKERVLPFANLTRRALRRLISEYEDPQRPDRLPERGQALFCSNSGPTTGAAMSRSGVQRLIRKLGERAGVSGVRCSPHTFRHSFSVEYLRNGGNTFSLQMSLGHSSPVITKRYVNLAEADLSNEHAKASPVDNLFRKRKG